MKKKYVISIISNVIIITLLGVLFCVTHINSGKYSDALAPIYRGDPEKKQVGIMINVYEGSEYVAEILKILDKYSVSCTFFVGGIWAQKNNALLIKNLEGTTNRDAYFQCHISLVFPDGRELIAEGRVEGEIIDEYRGSHGFGYDPIFLVKGENRTLAEMTDEEKNAISHRGAALKNLLEKL